MPGRPICPVISDSAISARAFSVPCACWLTPMPQKIMALLAVAKARATSRMASGSMPQTGAMASGVKAATWALMASKSRVCAAT